MYRCEVAVGGSITFVGPDSSWIRIDLLAIAGEQVQLGFAWPEEYRPRGGGRCVRLGSFRVRAMKFVGGSRVQLGIDTPSGFHADGRPSSCPCRTARARPPGGCRKRGASLRGSSERHACPHTPKTGFQQGPGSSPEQEL